MVIRFEQKEIERIYKFTLGLKSPTANKVYNALLGRHPAKGIINTHEDGGIVCSINEDIACEFLDVFVENAPQLGALPRFTGITLISKIKGNISTITSSLIKIFKRIQN